MIGESKSQSYRFDCFFGVAFFLLFVMSLLARKGVLPA
jgi:hypothetical protein